MSHGRPRVQKPTKSAGKLGRILHKEVNAKSFDSNINGKSPQKIYKISVLDSPNSCLVKIG